MKECTSENTKSGEVPALVVTHKSLADGLYIAHRNMALVGPRYNAKDECEKGSILVRQLLQKYRWVKKHDDQCDVVIGLTLPPSHSSYISSKQGERHTFYWPNWQKMHWVGPQAITILPNPAQQNFCPKNPAPSFPNSVQEHCFPRAQSFSKPSQKPQPPH